MDNHERRCFARLPLERRVKVMCPETGRCLGGITRNYSSGGCLVELDASAFVSRLKAGMQIRVGIDWTGHQGLLQAAQMPQASVIRTIGLTDRPQLALAFAHIQELAATG